MREDPIMRVQDIMKILDQDMKVAVFSTVDEHNQPHARHIHIGAANEKGIFFMTSPKTNFYKQLQHNDNIAITGFHEDHYLVQVIRITGKVRPIGREKLHVMLKDNPYVEQVYPNKDERQGTQVFHLYEGDGFYHSMSQGHRYTFKIDSGE